MDGDKIFVGKIGLVQVWHKRLSEDVQGDVREWVIAGVFEYEELVTAVAAASVQEEIKPWLKSLLDSLPAPAAVWCWEGEVVWCGAKGASMWLVRDGVHARLGEENTKASGTVVSGWVKSRDDYLILWGEVADLHLLSTREQFMAILEARAMDNSVAGVMIRSLGQEVVAGSEAMSGAAVGEVDLIEEPGESGVDLGEDVRLSWWRAGIAKIVKWLPRRDAVVEWHDARRERMDSRLGRIIMQGLAGVVLVGLLLVGIMGSVRMRESLMQSEVDALVAQIQGKIDEGTQIGSLNPTRSKAVFDEAVNLLTKLEEQAAAVEVVSQLRRQIASSLGEATGEYMSEPVVWQTLSLIRDGIVASSWSYDGEKLWIVDGAGGRLISISVANKASEVVLGSDDMSGIVRVSREAGGEMWLAGTRVVRRNNGGGQEVGWNGSEWGILIDWDGFGGNGYGASEKGIWRFRSEEGSLSVGQWLTDEALSRFLPPSGIAVDGAIWVVNGGEVSKYISGRRDTFTITNLSEPVLSLRDVYTDANSENLYLLDSGTLRVVAVNKETGAYAKQYKSESLGDVLGIVVDESQGKMWWLTAQIIYEVRL